MLFPLQESKSQIQAEIHSPLPTQSTFLKGSLRNHLSARASPQDFHSSNILHLRKGVRPVLWQLLDKQATATLCFPSDIGRTSAWVFGQIPGEDDEVMIDTNISESCYFKQDHPALYRMPLILISI